MKKIILLFIIMLIPINVYATSGGIKADNIVSCNGKYYGYHGDDKHWHEAEKKDSGRWYPKGTAIYSSNPCGGTTKKTTTTTKKSTTKETTKKTSTSTTTTTKKKISTKKSTSKSTTKKNTSKSTTTKKSTSKATISKKTSSKKTTTSKVTSTTKLKDTTKSSSNITTTKEVEKVTNEDADVGGFFTILGTSVVGLIGYEFYVDKKRGVFNKK